MKQLRTGTGFEKYARATRREQFLAELCARIAPHYPKAGDGCPRKDVEVMLHIYCLQLRFSPSDPAVEDALYDSLPMRRFAGIDLGEEPVPDETTICRFPQLLEWHGLGISCSTRCTRISSATASASAPAPPSAPPS